MQITAQHYAGLQKAYDFFNGELFGGSLPQLLITLQRKGRSYGYFSAKRFVGREEGEQAPADGTHELALNPDKFQGRTDTDILSTLVHEQCHVWQEEHGTASRRGHHNREWGAKMKEIGLYPSNTGQPGGRETGQQMTHYIIAGARFERACAKLLATGYKLEWQSLSVQGAARSKDASKTKFTCPDCQQNAWAKPDARLVCGACLDDTGDTVLMHPAALAA